MRTTKRLAAASLASMSCIFVAGSSLAADPNMGFFVTSVGKGDGGNLGGLEGADAHCQSLAEAVGSEGKTWRAYLSTQVEGEGDNSRRGIYARERIGRGPWYNSLGELIASDLDDLHISPNIVKRTALDENGNIIHGRGDPTYEHDILTGTKEDGTAYFPWEEGDHTCGNWTINSADGSAQVGHSDRFGGGNTSWNSAHPSRGCGQSNLKTTGGSGKFYCFAVTE